MILKLSSFNVFPRCLNFFNFKWVHTQVMFSWPFLTKVVWLYITTIFLALKSTLPDNHIRISNFLISFHTIAFSGLLLSALLYHGIRSKFLPNSGDLSQFLKKKIYQDSSVVWFLDRTPITQEIKARINKQNWIKFKNFCTAEEAVNRVEWEPAEWRKDFLSIHH